MALIYSQSQNIGKSNNLSKFGSNKTKFYLHHYFIGQYITCQSNKNSTFILQNSVLFLQEKCRYTGCFVGKKINNELCEQDTTPVATFENRSRPLIGYTLPLRFDLQPINKNNRSSIYDIFEQLHAALDDIYNIKVSLCLTMLRNETLDIYVLFLWMVQWSDSLLPGWDKKLILTRLLGVQAPSFFKGQCDICKRVYIVKFFKKERLLKVF
jgi:hypothetical protein